MGNDKKKKSSKKEDKQPENPGENSGVVNQEDNDERVTRSGKVRVAYPQRISNKNSKLSNQSKANDQNLFEQLDSSEMRTESLNNNANPSNEQKDENNVTLPKDRSRSTEVADPAVAGHESKNKRSSTSHSGNSKIVEETQPPGDGVQLNVTADEDNFEDSSASGESSSDETSSSSADTSSSEEDRRRYRKKKAKGKKSKLQKWKNDPDFLELVEQLVDKKTKRTRKRKSKKGESKITPKGKNIMKSPSDTTLYAPALQRLHGSGQAAKKQAEKRVPHDIAKGLRQIRLDNQFNSLTEGDESSSDEAQPKRGRKEPDNSSDDQEDPGQTEADRAVLAAEKFKAAIAPPVKGMAPGKYFKDDLDMEFLHVACHIDDATRTKIQNGEYVDLEKLLPKNNPIKFHKEKEEGQKMQLVNRDGYSCWVPAPKENKIDCFKKWEQAFRVYASIYCQANPLRSPEILSYIHVINMGAVSFAWDNVAHYDFSFRHYMERYPQRSWAQTNLQFWSLSMVDPLRSGGTSGQKTQKNWKEVACWRYNRNGCNRSAAECRFEHRCSFCGSFSHIYGNCNKRENKYKKGKKGKDKDDKKSSGSSDK